ncbi:MAG: HsmA family protein [Promethearchaeota archaeon]
MTEKMLLTFSIIFMILALTCYSIGVWSEQLSGKLKVWHLLFFWVGFTFDTSGTTIMSIISGSFTFNLHGITGAIAIFLMAFHAVWASIVLKQKNEKLISKFHRFNLIVWVLWLIPFITGMILNM